MNSSKVLKKIIIISLLILAMSFCYGCESKKIIPKGDWNVVETDNYKYYYIEDSEFTLNDVNNAIDRLEKFYDIVAPVWEFSSESKIKYYKFKSRDQRKKLTGRTGTGKAFFKKNIVHSIHAADAHEVSHLITTQHIIEISGEVKVSNFWLEGIAMYYTWPSVYYNENNNNVEPSIGYWQGKNVHNHLKEYYLDNNNLSDLSSFVYNNKDFDQLDDDLSYPMAGSFVTFLIGKNHTDMTNLDRFKRYIKEINQCNSQEHVLIKFEDIFGRSFSEQNNDWLEFLRN